MATQKPRGLNHDSAVAEELAIASYLERNPDFFERHMPMLRRLRLPLWTAVTTIIYNPAVAVAAVNSF